MMMHCLLGPIKSEVVAQLKQMKKAVSQYLATFQPMDDQGVYLRNLVDDFVTLEELLSIEYEQVYNSGYEAASKANKAKK